MNSDIKLCVPAKNYPESVYAVDECDATEGYIDYLGYLLKGTVCHRVCTTEPYVFPVGKSSHRMVNGEKVNAYVWKSGSYLLHGFVVEASDASLNKQMLQLMRSHGVTN